MAATRTSVCYTSSCDPHHAAEIMQGGKLRAGVFRGFVAA